MDGGKYYMNFLYHFGEFCKTYPSRFNADTNVQTAHFEIRGSLVYILSH